MRTFFSEIAETERYLKGEMPPDESVLFQARLLLDRNLSEKAFYHAKVHRMALLYRRKKMKERLQAVHEKFFSDPKKLSFRERILQIFNS
jgi:hypothetical protein